MSRPEFKHVDIYTSYEGKPGKTRMFYHVRVVPLETVQFPFGLGLAGKTTSREKAEKYAADVDEYLSAFVAYEKGRKK